MAHSLFAHLALQFGSHPENLATEALGFILEKSPAARAAVRDLLRASGAVVPDELTYATQVTGADDARPDLVARDDEGNEPVLMEVKFWAGLTENQPVNYLKRLKPGGTLLFVAPAARLPLLWGELRWRCEEAKQTWAETATNTGASTALVGERHLVLLSWRALLAAIHRSVDATGDRKTAEDVSQLDGLCERMDAEAFLPLTSEELTTTVYRRVLQFNAIVDDAVGKLLERGIASTKGLRSAAGSGYYGRYMWLRGCGAFLACDINRWMSRASTPLWLALYGPKWSKSNPAEIHRPLVAFDAAKPGRLFKGQDGFPAVGIIVPHGVERGDVLARVLAQVEEVGELIAPLASDKGGEESAPTLPDTLDGSS